MIGCGIDNIEQYDEWLNGKKIALITNPTGINRELKSTIDVLNERYEVTLLFSPEHGVRGDKQAGEHVETYVDEKTGIEVFSLYGQTRMIPDALNERHLFFDEMDLIFVNPSPNIPSMEAEILYNGTCLFEGTCLSEGRGTTKPFEIIGAPWIDGEVLAQRMNELQLPGVLFRPTYFTPTFSKHQGVMCGGVQIHVIDYKVIQAVEVGVRLLEETMNMTIDQPFFISPPFESDEAFFDKLSGTKAIRLGKMSFSDYLESCRADSKAFEQEKVKYHLY